MNDFLFALLSENLRPDAELDPRPWFAFVPNSWRLEWDRLLRTGLLTVLPSVQAELEERSIMPADLLSRAVVGLILLGLIAFFTYRVMKDTNPQMLAASIFYVLIWAWLLSPVQNPWYLLWALPWLPFARRWVWCYLPALAMLYYLRPWFELHFSNRPVWPTAYPGAEFFDFVVVWFEFAPWFIVLALQFFHGSRQSTH
jgi:hypothetical protein